MKLRYRILGDAKRELDEAAAYHEEPHHKRQPGYWAERLSKLER